MALHGLIEVNYHPVGEWQAVRIAGEPGEECTYQCTVYTRDIKTGKSGEPVEFELRHHYDHGAIWLAGSVLRMASAHMDRERLLAEGSLS